MLSGQKQIGKEIFSIHLPSRKISNKDFQYFLSRKPWMHKGIWRRQRPSSGFIRKCLRMEVQAGPFNQTFQKSSAQHSLYLQKENESHFNI